MRLTPWTSAGVDSDPATHFTLPRGELIGSDQGFRDAWELVRAEDPPRLRRLEDALLHVVAHQARGEKGTQGVQAMWTRLMAGGEPLPRRLGPPPPSLSV